MCLIGVPSLNEINPKESCFFLAQIIVANWCKEEKCEENQTISGTYISNTTKQIFLKFGM